MNNCHEHPASVDQSLSCTREAAGGSTTGHVADGYLTDELFSDGYFAEVIEPIASWLNGHKIERTVCKDD